MSEKRPTGSPFFHQRGEGASPSTLRSIEVAEEIAPDTEQELAPVYVEPQPLPALSDHKTIEIQTVKLADDIDPRKLPTELRLVRPPSVPPPPDSSWPYSDAGLAATQPPSVERRRSRARVAVAALFALLLLGSGLALRRRASLANVEPAASAVALASAAPASLAPASLAPADVPPAPSAADSTAAVSAVDSAAAAPSAVVNVADLPLSAGAEVPAPKPHHHATTHVSAKTSATTQPASEPATPSPSKPKRAIY